MNVVFEEQSPVARTPSSGRGIAAWMVRNHIADSISRAQTMLLIVTIIVLAVATFIGHSALSKDAIDTHKNFVPAVVR